MSEKKYWYELVGKFDSPYGDSNLAVVCKECRTVYNLTAEPVDECPHCLLEWLVFDNHRRRFEA